MRVGLIGHNSIEYIEELFNIWNNNDSAVLIDYDTPIDIIKKILYKCEVEVCYIEESLRYVHEIQKLFNYKMYSCTSKVPLILPNFIREKYIERSNDCEAVVINSSGTMGLFKSISILLIVKAIPIGLVVLEQVAQIAQIIEQHVRKMFVPV